VEGKGHERITHFEQLLRKRHYSEACISVLEFKLLIKRPAVEVAVPMALGDGTLTAGVVADPGDPAPVPIPSIDGEAERKEGQ
jgi:hypothetical protein